MNEKRKKVIEKILDKIKSGEIIDGNRLLPERILVETIGLTRPILRDGLIALDAMGVLDIRDRQGIFLSSNQENEAAVMFQRTYGWPNDMLSRAMEVRQLVEPAATGLAAMRRTDKDLSKMNACLSHIVELSELSGEQAAKEGAFWNTSYHTVIVESAKNAYLSRIYEGIWSIIEQGMSLMRANTDPESHGGRIFACKDHIRLFELIKAQDRDGAESFAHEHLQHTINAMIKLGHMAPVSNLSKHGLSSVNVK